MTKKMTQIQMTQFGSPEVLKPITVDIPEPKPGEVLIKISAIGVNYSDSLRRRNMYFQPTILPFVLGSEAVGEIILIGEGVPELYSKGSIVLAILPFGGGYAEYVCAIAQYCIPLPPSIDHNSATAIFVQGSSAQLMISEIAKELTNKTILINAAAGGVGSILTQLAKLNGVKVIAACSSEEKLKIAKSNGADELINYSQAGWNNKVKEITDGKGVDIAFEMVGGSIYTETIKSLAQGGQLIVYGAASGEKGFIHSEYFVDENISQIGFNLAYYINTKPEIWQMALGRIIELMAQGKLKINIPKIYSLNEASKAHYELENRMTTGKIVLNP